MGSEPRTAREALAALMLDEIDDLLTRVEKLPAAIATAEKRLAATVATLDAAGDKYRMMITAFTEEAKIETTNYLEKKTCQITARTMEEQRSAMQHAARVAFEEEVFEKTTTLAAALRQTAKDFRQPTWSRLAEHAITALIASSFTASFIYLIIN